MIFKTIGFKTPISMVTAILVAMLGLTASGASAAGESVTAFSQLKPRGPLSKTEPRPVGVHLEGKVSPGTGQLKLRELLRTKQNLTRDLSFWPSGTPACTKDIGQHDAGRANRPPAAVIADCPKSVIGDGTSTINVAGQVAAAVTDPVLTIFNGGRDKNGHPKLLIHGYSASVVPGGHGIMMTGALKNGVLDVKVPKLAANSAVTEFAFNIPGKIGKDPRYARAKCSSGKWKSTVSFTLADTDPNTGGFINKSVLTASPTFQNCVGKGGGKKKFEFSRPKVSGSHKAKRGQRRTYTVKIRNIGKKTIKRVKVTAFGKGAWGKRYVGNLKRNQTRKVKVKVKYRKHGKTKVRFKVSGRGAKAKSTAIRVRVR